MKLGSIPSAYASEEESDTVCRAGLLNREAIGRVGSNPTPSAYGLMVYWQHRSLSRTKGEIDTR